MKIFVKNLILIGLIAAINNMYAAEKRVDSSLDWLSSYSQEEVRKIPKQSNMIPLFQAAIVGDLKTVKKFLDLGMSCDTKFPIGECTPLILTAAVNGRLELANLLIEQKANVNAIDKKKRTALISAAQEGFEPIVRILIEANADVNHQDLSGNTPLLYATAYKSSYPIVRTLLHSNANPNIVAHNDIPALMYAANIPSKELVTLLIASKADMSRISLDQTLVRLFNKTTTPHEDVVAKECSDIFKLLNLYTHSKPALVETPLMIKTDFTVNYGIIGKLTFKYECTLTSEEVKKLKDAVEKEQQEMKLKTDVLPSPHDKAMAKEQSPTYKG